MIAPAKLLLACCAYFAIMLFCHAAGAAPDGLLGLPAPVALIHPQSQSVISLGRKIFFFSRLSRDGKVSCSTCHVPNLAFSDGKAQSIGVHGRKGTRNAPSLITASSSRSLFWDGRRRTLEDQALDPFLNEREHGLASEDELLAILGSDPDYRNAFVSAFGPSALPIRGNEVRKALASFQRSIALGDSAFDRFKYGGDKRALSESAIRGLKLFEGRAACVSCHRISPRSATFSDDDFHSLGIGLSTIPDNLDELTTTLVRSRQNGITDDHAVIGNPSVSELGRFVVTLNPRDIGKFRTPSLRNVALTAPYMHDGSIATLSAAIERELYFRGDNGRPLILTPMEKLDLQEFLRSLTSQIPSIGNGK